MSDIYFRKCLENYLDSYKIIAIGSSCSYFRIRSEDGIDEVAKNSLIEFNNGGKFLFFHDSFSLFPNPLKQVKYCPIRRKSAIKLTNDGKILNNIPFNLDGIIPITTTHQTMIFSNMEALITYDQLEEEFYYQRIKDERHSIYLCEAFEGIIKEPEEKVIYNIIVKMATE